MLPEFCYSLLARPHQGLSPLTFTKEVHKGWFLNDFVIIPKQKGHTLVKYSIVISTNYSISTGSWSVWGWKGSETVWFQAPAMYRDTFHEARLLEAPFNLALNAPRNGATTTSLDSLCHCLTTFTVRKFFRIPDVNLHSFGLKLLPSPCHYLPTPHPPPIKIPSLSSR